MGVWPVWEMWEKKDKERRTMRLGFIISANSRPLFQPFSSIRTLSIIERMSCAGMGNSAAFRLDKLRWVLISKTL